MENGIYNIPAKGGFGIIALQVEDGKARPLAHYKKGWSHNLTGPKPWQDLNEQQIEALKNYGKAEDQRFDETAYLG